MTASWIAAVCLVLAAGTSLVLSGAPWFRRTALVDRLGPYARHRPRPARSSAADLRRVVAPGLERWGGRVSAALGIHQDLALRLRRAGSELDASEFRVRQAGRGLVALLLGTTAAVTLGPAPAVAIAMAVGAPVLVVLLEEHRLSAATERRDQRLRAELPVVTEQLGLLLGAGYSLPGSIDRLARRSDGVIAADLRGVARRVRQGLGPTAALEEWATLSGLDEVGRLVGVLRLHDDAGDLGSLISQEARSMRAAAHRDLMEVIERRAQLVWIPVTVATLVPGLIFLAVPFMSAMSQVTGG